MITTHRSHSEDHEDGHVVRKALGIQVIALSKQFRRNGRRTSLHSSKWKESVVYSLQSESRSGQKRIDQTELLFPLSLECELL